jgi:hypothetical protein
MDSPRFLARLSISPVFVWFPPTHIRLGSSNVDALKILWRLHKVLGNREILDASKFKYHALLYTTCP